MIEEDISQKVKDRIAKFKAMLEKEGINFTIVCHNGNTTYGDINITSTTRALIMIGILEDVKQRILKMKNDNESATDEIDYG